MVVVPLILNLVTLAFCAWVLHNSTMKTEALQVHGIVAVIVSVLVVVNALGLSTSIAWLMAQNVLAMCAAGLAWTTSFIRLRKNRDGCKQ